MHFAAAAATAASILFIVPVLVLLPPSTVVLVDWLDEGSGTGKRVFLDDQKRIKFSVACDHPFENMSAATVLLKSIGSRMKKVNEGEREHIQELPLRLFSMYQLATTLDDLASAARGSPALRLPVSQGDCLVCQKDATLHPDNVVQCALCLLTFHPQCAHSRQTI